MSTQASPLPPPLTETLSVSLQSDAEPADDSLLTQSSPTLEDISYSSDSSSAEMDELKRLQESNEFSPIKSDDPSPHSTMYNSCANSAGGGLTSEFMQTAREDQTLRQDAEDGEGDYEEVMEASENKYKEAYTMHFNSIADDAGALESDGELIDLEELPETVTVLKSKDGSRTIYLVGTSHFSKISHRDVRRVIRTVQPAVVVLELCRSRMCFLSMGEKEIMQEAKSLDFSKIRDYIKRNGFVQGFIYTLLLTASAKVTNDLDMAPGGEFRNAFNEAMKIPGCTVMLGDRPVDITLRRAISTLSTWQKIKMTYNCLFSNEKLNEEELEKYKQKDVLEQLIGELAIEFPGLSRVMVQERDEYLAHSLWSVCQSTEPGANIVGVVGIGHSAGIQANWDTVERINIAQLVEIPKHAPSKTMFVLKYSFYGLVGYGVYRYAVPKVVKSFLGNVAAQVTSKVATLVSA